MFGDRMLCLQKCPWNPVERFAAGSTFYAGFEHDIYGLGETKMARNQVVDFDRIGGAYSNGKNGLLEFALVDEPRIAYDPLSLQRLGVIVEPEERNQLADANVSWASWQGLLPATGTFGFLGFTEGVAGAPDGTLSATSLRDSGHLHEQVINQPVGDYAGQKMIFSAYVKSIGHKYVRFGNGQAYSPVFDIVNGTVWGGDIDGAGTEVLGNGWVRCWWDATSPVDDTEFLFAIMGPNREAVWQGAGNKGVLVWGVQAEINNGVSSFVRKNGSVYRRWEDQIDFPASRLTSMTQGSAVIDVTIFDDQARSQSLLVGGYGPSRLIYREAGHVWSFDGSSTIDLGEYTPGHRFKAAVAWSNDGAEFYGAKDGVASLPSPYVSGSFAASKIGLMSDAGHNSTTAGIIHSARFYGEAKSEAFLMRATL